MARVRIRAGDSEIEVDSRDFYVDNETIRSVVEGLSRCLPPTPPRRALGDGAGAGVGAGEPGREGLWIPQAELCDCNDDSDGTPGAGQTDHQTRQLDDGVIELLEVRGFFDSPRTASDVVRRLGQDGYGARCLDVSKALVRMSIGKKIQRHSGKGGASTYVSDSPRMSEQGPAHDGLRRHDEDAESLVVATAAV